MTTRTRKISRAVIPALALLGALLMAAGSAAEVRGLREQSRNKSTVKLYMAAFDENDRDKVLSCLTEDVEWRVPGAFHAKGKVAFAREIRNDAFVGRPNIKVARMTEENGVVVAEGSVHSRRKAGGYLDALFCDVFEMREGKIRKLTSYLVVLPVE